MGFDKILNSTNCDVVLTWIGYDGTNMQSRLVLRTNRKMFVGGHSRDEWHDDNFFWISNSGLWNSAFPRVGLLQTWLRYYVITLTTLITAYSFMKCCTWQGNMKDPSLSLVPSNNHLNVAGASYSETNTSLLLIRRLVTPEWNHALVNFCSLANHLFVKDIRAINRYDHKFMDFHRSGEPNRNELGEFPSLELCHDGTINQTLMFSFLNSGKRYSSVHDTMSNCIDPSPIRPYTNKLQV